MLLLLVLLLPPRFPECALLCCFLQRVALCLLEVPQSKRVCWHTHTCSAVCLLKAVIPLTALLLHFHFCLVVVACISTCSTCSCGARTGSTAAAGVSTWAQAET